MGQETKHPRILLADTDPSVRQEFMSLSKSYGWHVETSEEGEAILPLVAKERFDVIVSDFLLPSINGERLVEKIHGVHSWQALVILTAHGSAERAIELIRRGAVDYLKKPLDKRLLTESISRVISHLHQENFERGIYKFIQREESFFLFHSEDLNGIDLPCLLVERLFRGGIIDLTTKLKLTIAFQEALANHHEHGNLELRSEWKEEFTPEGIDKYSVIKQARLQDPHYGKRKLYLKMIYDDHRLEIILRDEGNGFSPECPLEKKNGIASFGRGLAIIAGSMDTVEHASGGREIRMVKFL